MANKPFARLRLSLSLVAGAVLAAAGTAGAAESVNIYSARHYDSDDLIYHGFERATGITVNVIEAEGPALLARMKAEGANSPADIFITVDAGNLWAAEAEGLFQPAHSAVLNRRIPASLRSPENLWFGFSTRARVIFVNPARVDPEWVTSYQSLADPRLRGQICMRTSSAIYNLSLLGALIAHLGPQRAEDWVRGVVANFARPPQGADTTLLLGVAVGECGVTIANHYYYVRLATSRSESERAAAATLVPIFPDQDGRGTHVNISGAGLLASAPHREAGVKFLEYLAGDQAQAIFSSANHEYPAVPGIAPAPELTELGTFKADPVNVSVYGENQIQAQMIFDRAGWR